MNEEQRHALYAIEMMSKSLGWIVENKMLPDAVMHGDDQLSSQLKQAAEHLKNAHLRAARLWGEAYPPGGRK